MLEQNVLFAVDDIQRIEFSDYADDEFAIAKVGFLSTRPNAHGLIISEDVLRECAPSALGKWMVAEIKFGDADTHTQNQHIMGQIPKNQEIEFVEDDDGYLRAYADAVISKIYAKEYCAIFERDNNRAVSVEMRVVTDGEDDNNVLSFNIVGVTTLGKTVLPSCPESDVEFIRFAENEADDYFNKVHLTALKSFARERNKAMAEEKYVDHPINESKDAIYTGDWDGEKAKRDLIKEKNYKTLAPKVCLRLEDGWEDREITKLGYPIMGLYDGEWRYSTHALASAKAYAEKNDETEVLNKLKEIYKKLDLDDDDGKEEKMSEDIKLETPDVEMAEEEKDAEMAQDENVECAEPEKVEEHDDADDKHDDDEDEKVEMSAEEMMAKIAELEADIENRDHIIMDKDAELEELRAYKATMVAKEMACRVDALMEEVGSYLDNEQMATFREEGLSCDESNIDAWANKVKATCFSAVKKENKKNDKGVFSFAAPIAPNKWNKTKSIWE